jgi:TPR repeat protein
MNPTKKESLNFLSSITEAIATASDAQSLADALFNVVDNFINVPYSSIFLWDFKEDRLRLYANKGFSEEDKIYSENIDTSYYSRMMQAYMLANGLGVNQDYKVAFELMEDVANVNPQAQLHLAVMYANGLGVEKSYDKANLYLKKA